MRGEELQQKTDCCSLDARTACGDGITVNGGCSWVGEAIV